jgi:hypothetical protein
LLYFSSYDAKVHISRLHFKGARATRYGGAIYNSGTTLTLEACIFSDNVNTETVQADDGGGAVYSSGALTVLGCTFFRNTTTGAGGAINKRGNTDLTLAGNVFWDNTAAASNPVVFMNPGSVITKGYNVSDQTGNNSGWTFANGDVQASFLPVSSVNFKPISGGAAAGIIQTSLAGGYPEKDFYGETITIPGAAAGAVRTPTMGSGFVLGYDSEGPGGITIPSGGTPNADGLISVNSSVTLKAEPIPPYGVFQGWTVNGTAAGFNDTLTLFMDGHKIVRARFSHSLIVNSSADSGPGTLREALLNAYEGGTININLPPEDRVITLASPLPQITTSLVIEGNGATLTQEGFTPSADSQLLYIDPPSTNPTATIRISRLRFDGGRAISYGAAIQQYDGNLILESCIFTHNQTDNGQGGAVNSGGALTVLGCTFYGNTAGITTGSGGALFTRSDVTLTGNIFWMNTAKIGAVVYSGVSSIARYATSGGYNVSDREGGPNAGFDDAQSGWVFNNTPGTEDVYLTNLGIYPETGFKPYSTVLPVIASLPQGFPLTYFDGSSRGSNSAPGAMPAEDDTTSPGPGPGAPGVPSSRPQDYSVAPAQAAGLKSVPGMQLVHLSWFPTARAESYEVYYSPATNTDFASATKWAEEPTEPAATVKGLNYGAIYNFWVIAKNRSGPGARSRMFTMPRRVSDPLPIEYVYRGQTPTVFLADNNAGDYYQFVDQGDTFPADERYKFGYGSPNGTIKYVDLQASCIIYSFTKRDGYGNEYGTRYIATYGAGSLDNRWPYRAPLGQANGYTSGMGNNQETDTLEEALEKFAVHPFGHGIKGGMYEYITGMDLRYVLVIEAGELEH